MPLETVNNIDDLDQNNPIDDDPVNEGDNHIRNVKLALQKNVGGDDVSTQLKQNDIVALNADANGVQVTGQATVSEAAPVAVEDVTRKDYVDGELAAAVASLQTQIDNILNGTTPFTGVVNGIDWIANGP